MKIGGKKLDYEPASEYIVFPRQSGELAVRAKAVMDRTEFDKWCKPPKPPQKRVKGGQLEDNYDDPRYTKSIAQHGDKYIQWLIITSLCFVEKGTEADVPIEWEKVNKTKPDTWGLWDEEFKEIGFSDMERKRIHNMVVGVNSLNDRRLDEARSSFLRPREAEPEPSSSPDTEQADTESGEPVKGSESDLQESPNDGTTLTTK